jgi:hypothetical protein
MRIDDLRTATGIGFVVAAGVGGLGAYIIKPILKTMSPIGVALTCGITAAIAIAVLFSDLDFRGKFVSLMAAYPLGLISSNLLSFNVRFLDPMVSVFIGGLVIVPMVLTAFFFSVASSLFRQ